MDGQDPINQFCAKRGTFHGAGLLRDDIEAVLVITFHCSHAPLTNRDTPQNLGTTQMSVSDLLS